MIEYLPVEVINAIGSFETCTNWGRIFRSKNPRKLVEDINTRLAEDGYNPSVIKCFLAAAPLLAENAAIQSFNKSDKISLLSFRELPVISTIAGALLYAGRYGVLTNVDEIQLKRLFLNEKTMQKFYDVDNLDMRKIDNQYLVAKQYADNGDLLNANVCFESAAAAGKLEAMEWICEHDQRSVDKYYLLKYKKELGNAGYDKEQVWLAKHYFEIDEESSIKWFDEAAKNGNPEAIDILGYYWQCCGENSKALDCYLKMAEAGYRNYQFIVGEYYLASDYEKAIYWLEKADNNNIDFYNDYNLNPKDERFKNIYSYYNEKRKEFFSPSYYTNLDGNISGVLAAAYLDKCKKDQNKELLKIMFSVLHRSARKGYKASQLAVAKMYEFGIGVEEDYYEAEKWYLNILNSSGEEYANDNLSEMEYSSINLGLELGRFYVKWGKIDKAIDIYEIFVLKHLQKQSSSSNYVLILELADLLNNPNSNFYNPEKALYFYNMASKEIQNAELKKANNQSRGEIYDVLLRIE